MKMINLKIPEFSLQGTIASLGGFLSFNNVNPTRQRRKAIVFAYIEISVGCDSRRIGMSPFNDH